MEFPIMLYRPEGAMLEWDGAMWDYVICADADEVELARMDGFALPGEEAKAKAKPKAKDGE